jgi:hypothetical protein
MHVFHGYLSSIGCSPVNLRREHQEALYDRYDCVTYWRIRAVIASGGSAPVKRARNNGTLSWRSDTSAA